MNSDKVRTEQRMHHPDETLHDGGARADSGPAVAKKKRPKKTVEDRRDRPAGPEALKAKLAKKPTVKTRPHQVSSVGCSRKDQTRGTAKKPITTRSRTGQPQTSQHAGRSRAPGSGSPDPGQAAEVLGAFLAVLRNGEIAAPQGVVDRLEGAYLAMTVLASGRYPSPKEFFGTDQANSD